jgi:hypothetical protein
MALYDSTIGDRAIDGNDHCVLGNVNGTHDWAVKQKTSDHIGGDYEHQNPDTTNADDVQNSTYLGNHDLYSVPNCR